MDIDELMTKLAKRRPIFHSEADFQHSLAWLIHEEYPECEVRLEYPTRLLIDECEKGSIDIWVNDLRIAIELKYKTSPFDAPWKGEIYHLKKGYKHHWGYLFTKDIERLEKLTTQTNANEGYAIILTNHKSFGNQKERIQGASEDFRLLGILEGEKQWKGTDPKRSEPIILRGRYELDWSLYSKHRECEFRYLAVQVK